MVKNIFILNNQYISSHCSFICLDSNFRQVNVSPVLFDRSTPITLQFDAKQADVDATNGMVATAKIYLNAGAMINDPRTDDWSFIIGNWDVHNDIGEMTNVGSDLCEW